MSDIRDSSGQSYGRRLLEKGEPNGKSEAPHIAQDGG